MNSKQYYSIALSFLSLFASAFLCNYVCVNVPAYFLGMAIWFFAVGVGHDSENSNCKKSLKNFKYYCLVIAFCMNTAIVATIPFFYEHRRSGDLIYVDYMTCLLYGLIFSAVGIVITTIVLAAKNTKNRKNEGK